MRLTSTVAVLLAMEPAELLTWTQNRVVLLSVEVMYEFAVAPPIDLLASPLLPMYH